MKPMTTAINLQTGEVIQAPWSRRKLRRKLIEFGWTMRYVHFINDWES